MSVVMEVGCNGSSSVRGKGTERTLNGTASCRFSVLPSRE